jgi:serine protease Do
LKPLLARLAALPPAGVLALALLPLAALAQDFEALLRGAQFCAVSVLLAPRAGPSEDERSAQHPADDMKRLLPGRSAPRRTQMPTAVSGLGLLWRDARHVLTTQAVVDAESRPVVEDASGRRQLAERLGQDLLSGAVLLRLPEPVQGGAPCAWGASAGLRLGQDVVAVGHFAELRWTLQRGHVSALRRAMPDATLVEHFIETSARSGPGMAGGPLMDLQGRVVGVNEATYGSAGQPALAALALPIEPLLAAAEALHAGKPPMRAQLGLRLGEEKPTTIEAVLKPQPGVPVEAVDAGRPAEQAGVRVGDRLLALDGRPLDSSRAWTRATARLTPGKPVSLLLRREGQALELRVTPEAAPPPP